ncbi:ABC transport system integral membrane protein [Streptomyces bingchenggensis BCW-1]|uniref:ABC transport system integral membrane protein n=1 Tax=Streptomyces bingchenggensis (strain BCW-1) TaxID=749414 RepID=D7BTL8_STRBB|nr:MULTISPECIES: FtsX-like permease family protein [Streptomyces]ADI07457.1 ABC transport system integral membrane protein [Streptomyces bingchenggensis BCW-1]
MTVLKTSMRNFFAHKGRMALSAIAVLLSVAFVCGTLVFTDTTNATFDQLFASTSSDVSVKPKKEGGSNNGPQTGKIETVPGTRLAELKKVQGVKSVDGEISTETVTVVDKNNDDIGPKSGAPTVATNWDPTELLAVDLTSGHEPRGPTEVMLDADTAKNKKLKIGDELRLIAVPGEFRAKIVGLTTFKVTNPGATIVYTDTATAQSKLLGRPDAYTSFALTAQPGVSNDQLKKNVVAAIGDGYKVQTKDESAEEGKDDIGSFLDIMKYAMLGFAGIAVLVGIFLIVNTFSMLVAQRTREIGLMRAIGSSRKQVNRSVLIEALLLGVVGSVLGVLGGIGLAVGLMKFMGSQGLNISTDQLTVKPATPIIGLTIGIVVTVIAAYIPARRAGKISPMAALRDAGTPADAKAGRIRGAIGLLLTGAGVVALVAAANADKATDGSMLLGLGVLLTLIGFIVIGPLLAGLVVRVLAAVILRIFGPVGRMAERNALRNPRRTGATGAALMIGLALVACLSVVGSSMVASASDELDKSVGADFIVQSDGGKPITGDVVKAVHAAKGLDHVTDVKNLNDTKITTPDGKTSTDNLVAADPKFADDLRTPVVDGTLSDAYGKDAISVSEDFAKDHKVKMGDTLTVTFVGGRTAAKLKVAAITSDDTSLNKGAKYVNITTAERYIPADKMPVNAMMLAAAKDGQEKAAYASLKAQLDDYPQVKVRDQTDYKKMMKDQIGQLLNLVYGLLALAIVVAVLGVVNTLALSVVERTREIGLMRAIGMSRRQLRRMIRLESVVIALFGALLGLGLGMGWGATAQKLLALEGLKTLEIPWSTIITVFIGSAVVGLVAALLPAFRAGRMNVLNAIATE